MVDGLTNGILAAAAVLALWSGFLAWRNLPVNRLVLGLAGLLEAGLLAQLVIGCVALARGDQDVNGGIFVAYLAGVVLVPPLAVGFAITERSRWSAGVLAVAGFAVVVMVARLEQVWGGPNG